MWKPPNKAPEKGLLREAAVALKPAVSGAWRHRGGGAFFLNVANWQLHTPVAPRLDVKNPDIRVLDQSRIGDVLCGDSQPLQCGPPVTAMFMQNANSAVVAPDSQAVRKGLTRDDLFLCVHEQFMTDTAKYADLVLPATMFVEHDDMYKGGGHMYLQVARKIIEPYEECRSNHEVICALGQRLGSEHPGFHMSAWEMIEQSNISVHDSFGSNLMMHTLRNEVIRVVPKENSEVNETWISDRDRFSYEGMYSDNRLTQVMQKNAGEWEQSDWPEALHSVAATLKLYDAEDIGFLVSPNQSNEEIYLLQKLTRALNIKNIDHRINQVDFEHQHADPAFPWLGQNIEDVEKQDAILIIGSDLRSEQPMLTHRVRKARARGSKVFVFNPHHCEFHMNLSAHVIVKPQAWLVTLVGSFAMLNSDAYHQHSR